MSVRQEQRPIVTIPLAAIVSAVIAVGFWRSHTARPWLQRLSAGAGVCSIAALAALGSLWPSMHTIAALLALPAVAMLLVRIAKPAWLRSRWPLAYTRFAVLLPPAAFAFQYWWLNGGCQALGECA